MSVAKATTVLVEKNRIAFSGLSPVTNPDEYIHSSLIHEVYLNNDLKNDFPKFWGRTAFEEGGFGDFFQDIKELVANIKSLSGKKLDHSQTVKEVISPVLAALGWRNSKEMLVGNNLIITNKFGDEISIKPTYTLFSSENDAKSFSKHYKSSTKPSDQFNFIPVATSYFGAWADQKASKYDKARDQHGRFGDIFSALGTDEQAYNYTEILNSEWCFSTDGHSWRLIKKSAFAIDHNKYFEFNFWGFLNALSTAKPHEEDALVEILKSFYWFFSKESHLISKPNQISLTWERAKKYTDNLEDDLRTRFVAAMSIAVNSLWTSSKRENIEIDLNTVQNIGESLIFNSLFIRSCESRRILPLHQNYIPVSLHNLASKLRDLAPESTKLDSSTKTRLFGIFGKDILDNGFELFDYLITLFDLTTNSSKKARVFGFAIEGFSEHIFSVDDWKTIQKVKINNIDMGKILTVLFYEQQGVQVPFNIITPQQFGTIFEGFLEYKLSKVSSTVYLVKRISKGKVEIFWSPVVKKDEIVIYEAKKGNIYYMSDDIDRKISGSYYTPDYIVDFVVANTLAPLTKNKTSEEFMNLKICDPAMGSGHFLISALRFLSSEFIKNYPDSKMSKFQVKVAILKRCLFGIDVNKRAVKLAKLALWLETAETGKQLEHLDDQLIVADSIFSKNIFAKVKKQIMPSGISAVIGNPPYGIDFDDEQVIELFKRFETLHQKHDSFHIFIERLLLDKDWLQYQNTDDYRVGLIIPDTILSLDCFKKLRDKILSSNCNADFILNKYDVFDSANVSTLLMLVKGINQKKPTLRIAKSILPSDLNDVIFDNVDIQDSLADKTNRFVIRFASPLNGYDKSVSDFFEATAGAQAYEVGKGTPKQTKAMMEGKVYNSTKKVDRSYRPYLYGSDISAFVKTWKNAEYVKYGHNLTAPRDPWFHTGDRVVVQRIRNPKLPQRLVAAFIDDESVSSVGLSIIKPKEGFEQTVSSKALAVFLNLPSVNAWYSQINNDVNIKPTVLKTIPITEEILKFGGVLDKSFDKLAKLVEAGKDKEKNELIIEIDANLFNSQKIVKKLS